MKSITACLVAVALLMSTETLAMPAAPNFDPRLASNTTVSTPSFKEDTGNILTVPTNDSTAPSSDPTSLIKVPDNDAIGQSISLAIHSGLHHGLEQVLGPSFGEVYVRPEDVDGVEMCIGEPVFHHLATCLRQVDELLVSNKTSNEPTLEAEANKITACLQPEHAQHIAHCIEHAKLTRLIDHIRLLEEKHDHDVLHAAERDGAAFAAHPHHHRQHHRHAPGTSNMVQYNEEMLEPMFEQDEIGESPTPTVGWKPTKSTVPFDTLAPALNVNKTASTLDQTNRALEKQIAFNSVDKKASSVNQTDAKDPLHPEPRLAKRKFGYGPLWQTLPGRRDTHPLP